MKWISVKDRAPDVERAPMLVFIENQIYLGSIHSYTSSKYDGQYKLVSTEKVSTFYVDLPYEKCECGDCTGDVTKQCRGQCTDCCETDHAIDEKQLVFSIKKIEYWMLIESPK